MINFAIIENGVVVNTVVASPEFAEKQGWIELPEGVGIGWQYDSGAFTDPNAPSQQEILERLSNSIRYERDRLLEEEVDKINPMRWETFTAEEQTLWKNYRQALLNVPQQEGFPETVTWPSKPY